MLCWGVVTNGIAHHTNSSAFRTHRFFSINKKMEKRVVGEAYIISTSMIPNVLSEPTHRLPALNPHLIMTRVFNKYLLMFTSQAMHSSRNLTGTTDYWSELN